jgi:hypothetical protein
MKACLWIVRGGMGLGFARGLCEGESAREIGNGTWETGKGVMINGVWRFGVIWREPHLEEAMQDML